MPERICAVPDCDRAVSGRHDWCRMHQRRWERTGDVQPDRPSQRGPGPERFWRQVDKRGPDECWPWTGTPGTGGYGQIMIDGVLWLTHRYAYVHVVAPIPDGYTLDHLCHTRDTSCPGGQCPHRLCCNPAHLEPVTRGDNTLHGRTITAANVAKTHCPKNHPYTAENTLIRRCGRRMCRECARERARRYYWAKKGMPGGADKGMGRPD